MAEPRVEEYIRRREDVHDKAILICGVEAGRNVAVIEPALEERFREQAEKWDKETAHISSPVQRFSHPSYMAILGMAQDDRDKVIDLLLRDMRDNSREWFWALSYLTHENPVTRKESGRLNKMIDAWVRWGKERGRI